MRASLDAYATDNILVIDARLVLQKEIALEQRKVRGVGGGHGKLHTDAQS
jgi:hypothetical protein